MEFKGHVRWDLAGLLTLQGHCLVGLGGARSSCRVPEFSRCFNCTSESHIHPPEWAWPIKAWVYGLHKHFTREVKASITQWLLPTDSSPIRAFVKLPGRSEIEAKLVYTPLPPSPCTDPLTIQALQILSLLTFSEPLPLTLWAFACPWEYGYSLGGDGYQPPILPCSTITSIPVFFFLNFLGCAVRHMES